MNVLLWMIVLAILLPGIALVSFTLLHSRQREVRGVDEAIRVAIVHDNRVLLVPHRSNQARYKHPLYMELDRNVDKESALGRLMKEYLPAFDEEPKFLLKYHVEDKPQKIVYLYVLNISSEPKVLTAFPEGSFLDCLTIDRYAEDGRLSHNFMEEFSYLRNTVILCNNLISNRNKCCEQ